MAEQTLEKWLNEIPKFEVNPKVVELISTFTGDLWEWHKAIHEQEEEDKRPQSMNSLLDNYQAVKNNISNMHEIFIPGLRERLANALKREMTRVRADHPPRDGESPFWMYVPDTVLEEMNCMSQESFQNEFAVKLWPRSPAIIKAAFPKIFGFRTVWHAPEFKLEKHSACPEATRDVQLLTAANGIFTDLKERGVLVDDDLEALQKPGFEHPAAIVRALNQLFVAWSMKV